MCDVTRHLSLLSFTRKSPYFFLRRKSVPCSPTQRNVFFQFKERLVIWNFIPGASPHVWRGPHDVFTFCVCHCLPPSHLLLQVVAHNIACSAFVSADYDNRFHVIPSSITQQEGYNGDETTWSMFYWINPGVQTNVILRELQLKKAQPCCIKKETLEKWMLEGKSSVHHVFLEHME